MEKSRQQVEGNTVSGRVSKEKMKRFFGYLVIMSSAIIYSSMGGVVAATKGEIVGIATGRYSGSILFLKVIGESKCKSSLTISPNVYEIERMKSEVSGEIKKFVSKKELEDFRAGIDAQLIDIRDAFLPLLNKTDSQGCNLFANEMT